MKINRLASTEVANIASLAPERRHNALLKVEQVAVRWGYGPVTSALPKLLLAESPLLGPLPKGDDKALLLEIEKRCKSGPAQVAACSSAAKAIIDWRNTCEVSGRFIDTEPLRTTVDTLRYCSDVAVVMNGGLHVIYFDPRSSMKLTRSGQELIKSLIYHTALFGDLRDAMPAMLCTPRATSGNRVCRFEVMSGEPAYSMEEIIDRVQHTYSIWEAILRSRRAEASRPAEKR